MSKKNIIEVDEVAKIDYDNYGNGGFDEWITFSNENFYIKIHGDIVTELLHNNFINPNTDKVELQIKIVRIE